MWEGLGCHAYREFSNNLEILFFLWVFVHFKIQGSRDFALIFKNLFLISGKCYGIRAYGTFMLGFEGFVLLILFCEMEIYTNGMGFTNGIFGVWGFAFYIIIIFERREKFYCIGIWLQWATQQEKLLFL